MTALVEGGDPGRIPIYMAALAMALVLAIMTAGSLGRGPGPSWIGAAAAAIVISLIGILCAKYGAQFGAPWVVYAAPLAAAIVIPPFAFRFDFWRTMAYIALVAVAVPLLHAAFFYGLGWDDFLPFLRLPPRPM